MSNGNNVDKHEPILRDKPSADRLPLVMAILREKFGLVMDGMDGFVRQLDMAALRKDSLLVLGEPGVGKSEIVQALDYLMQLNGRNGRMLTVNCSEIPPELAASTLFGHEKGSFTGADRKTNGLFHEADGGRLFLDEIAELVRDAQAKLLTAIQNGIVRRVGSTINERVNVQVIAATNVPRHELFSRVRSDLYSRLSGHVIEVPPIRSRPEVARRALIEQAFSQAHENLACPQVDVLVEEDAMQILSQQQFPGNMRELGSMATDMYAREYYRHIGETSPDRILITEALVQQVLSERTSSTSQIAILASPTTVSADAATRIPISDRLVDNVVAAFDSLLERLVLRYGPRITTEFLADKMGICRTSLAKNIRGYMERNGLSGKGGQNYRSLFTKIYERLKKT